ncbi:hypothetical protein [Streptomyces bluensis]|uniref:hypothetical protein n=1 Tax=Streptomyces bluensis TaxID=33897 RepID=UPI003316D802
MTNAFAMLRLLPMSGREKEVEILALRHRIAVLERQLNGQRVWFEPSDRAFLVALLQGLPREVLRRMRLLVRPDTLLRRHRNLIAGRHAAQSRSKRGAGRAPCARSGRWCALEGFGTSLPDTVPGPTARPAQGWDAVAQQYGTASVAARRKALHAAERAAYREALDRLAEHRSKAMVIVRDGRPAAEALAHTRRM